MSGVTARPVLYTIGHGSSSFAPFRERLEAHGVQTVVDVRSQPHSSHAPDFDRDELDEELRAAGFGYRWMGDRLGGRPTDPGLLDAAGHPDWSLITASPRFTAAVAEVSGLADGAVVALLCAESDPAFCHRETALAPHFEAAGFSVVHILADGSLRPHQPDLGL